MAVFHSKYRELSFYVNGEKHSFASGTYSTDDTKVIAVLETLADAKRIDEPKQVAAEVEQPKEDEKKPEEKPSTRRKASAK